MRKFSRFIALAASGALGLTGCSNPFGHSNGIANGSQSSFDQMAADQQRRSVVAPAMGLDNNVEPTATQKFGASVAAVPAKIGSSISSGAQKATSWMAPSSTATASTATSTDSGWFGKKKDVSPELHVATAHVYEKNGNYADAAAEYEKALKSSPNNVPALLSYAHLRDHEGKLTEATGLYARAVKANPHEAASFNDLGLCYARRGMINDSLKSLSKAIELQPERALYRNNLATVLVDQGRSDEALAQLRAVQSEAVANYNVGYLLLERKQNALAEASFRRAMLLDPSLVEARDMTERLALSAPAQPSVASFQRSNAPVAQMAALPTSTPRPGAYGPAPEPTASVYLQPQIGTASNTAFAGSRYAGTAPAAVGNSAALPAGSVRSMAPPTPDTLSNYQPAVQDAELKFLPPVQ